MVVLQLLISSIVTLIDIFLLLRKYFQFKNIHKYAWIHLHNEYYIDDILVASVYNCNFKQGAAASTCMVSRINFFHNMCMCLSVCPPLRLVITSGMKWTPYDWLNKFYSLILQLQLVSLVDKPEPIMLKILLIIPSSTSQKITHYSYLILPLLPILFPYYSFALMFQVRIDI